MGFDANTGKFVDMFSAGIIDPTKVTRSALQNAASIAALMLTTEAMITNIKDDEKEACRALNASASWRRSPRRWGEGKCGADDSPAPAEGRVAAPRQIGGTPTQSDRFCRRKPSCFLSTRGDSRALYDIMRETWKSRRRFRSGRLDRTVTAIPSIE